MDVEVIDVTNKVLFTGLVVFTLTLFMVNKTGKLADLELTGLDTLSHK
jgi:hypothetical protein